MVCFIFLRLPLFISKKNLKPGYTIDEAYFSSSHFKFDITKIVTTIAACYGLIRAEYAMNQYQDSRELEDFSPSFMFLLIWFRNWSLICFIIALIIMGTLGCSSGTGRFGNEMTKFLCWFTYFMAIISVVVGGSCLYNFRNSLIQIKDQINENLEDVRFPLSCAIIAQSFYSLFSIIDARIYRLEMLVNRNYKQFSNVDESSGDKRDEQLQHA